MFYKLLIFNKPHQFCIISFHFQGLLFASIDAIGSGILAFNVFPKLDLVRSILLMNGMGFIPAALQLFSFFFLLKDVKNCNGRSICMNAALNLAVTLMQLSVFIITCVSNYTTANSWSILIGITCVSISMSRDFFNLSAPTSGK